MVVADGSTSSSSSSSSSDESATNDAHRGDVDVGEHDDDDVSTASMEDGPSGAGTNIMSGVGGGKNDVNDDVGFPPTLLPTLLFKFIIVLLVKFATDAVVYPSLFAYRLVRLCKRRMCEIFERLFARAGGGGKEDGR
jgi:hypothetical protein